MSINKSNEKRINEMKELLSCFMNTIHDVIVDTTNESKEWYEMFFKDMTSFEKKLEMI